MARRSSPAPAAPVAPIGAQLRSWRQRRRRSQLDLALDAGISQRHLSFVESGRAVPSQNVVLLLAERLDIPLRDRNSLLLSAGYAPFFHERPLSDPVQSGALMVVETILRAHAPNPALVLDRRWHMLSANAAVAPLLAGVADPLLLQPPINVLRLSLHPGGLAPHIANLPEWRSHLLDRLRRQTQASGDPCLLALLAEVAAFGSDRHAGEQAEATPPGGIAVPLLLDTAVGRLSLISTTTVFGAPLEVTLSEIAIEAFYPTDGASAALLLHLQRDR